MVKVHFMLFRNEQMAVDSEHDCTENHLHALVKDLKFVVNIYAEINILLCYLSMAFHRSVSECSQYKSSAEEGKNTKDPLLTHSELRLQN